LSRSMPPPPSTVVRSGLPVTARAITPPGRGFASHLRSQPISRRSLLWEINISHQISWDTWLSGTLTGVYTIIPSGFPEMMVHCVLETGGCFGWLFPHTSLSLLQTENGPSPGPFSPSLSPLMSLSTYRCSPPQQHK
jgi:hypothetical protein